MGVEGPRIDESARINRLTLCETVFNCFCLILPVQRPSTPESWRGSGWGDRCGPSLYVDGRLQYGPLAATAGVIEKLDPILFIHRIAMRLVSSLLLIALAGSYGCHTNPTPAPPAVADPADLTGDWSKMRVMTPRHYICYRARAPIAIDGQSNEASWGDAPWTEDFADIEGPPKPAPRFRTRAKMLWDDQNLYVYAELEEPHVWGTITKKNEVIFYDNDFEVFIDPDGDNHNYYEFEMNALNTIWELTLVKPYRDGGPAHLGTNLEGLRSAVHVRGTFNKSADTDRGWSVEIALSLTSLARYAKDLAW